MKNKPDFEHPAALVAEVLLSCPRRKPLSHRALTKRFLSRYGRRCADWMVWRGIAGILDQQQPGWRSTAEALLKTLPDPQAE